MFDPALIAAARARAVADHISPLQPDLRRIRIEGAALSTGGTILHPRDTPDPGTHMVQIHLLGVMGMGESFELAAQDWIKSARRAQPSPSTLTTQGTAA